MTTPVDFLRLILPPAGPYALLVRAQGRNKPHNEFAPTLEALWQQMASWEARGAEVWHACASFKRPENDPRGTKQGDRRLGRTGHNIALVKALWLDVDGGEGKPYADARAAAEAVLAFARAAELPMPILVASGAGVHAYWPLREAMLPSQWKVLAKKLKLLCRQHNLEADPARTADTSSVLRTPGTHNYKRGLQLVRCYQLVGPYKLKQLVGLNVDLQQLAQVPVKQEVNVPEHLRIAGLPRLADRAAQGMVERPDVSSEDIAGQCGQISAFRDSRGVLPEPVWQACLGVLAYTSDGDDKGQEWSSGYDGYTEEETRDKMERWRETVSGATTCERFRGLNPAPCEACPLWGRIKSPIGAMRGVVAVPPVVVNGTHALPNFFDEAQGKPKAIRFDVNKDGIPIATCANAYVAIKDGLQLDCRKDTFHEKMLVGGHAINAWGDSLSDDVVYMIRRLIYEKFRFDPSDRYARDASIQICLERQFNPVVDYLAALQWDGRARIGRWTVDYLGAADTTLNREFGHLMLIAAVRRARAPGTKFDQIVVLEGKEGTGKSSAVKILAGEENFSDQHILGASDKEQQEAFTGVWLHEIAELAGMKRTDVERIKQFASRTEDRARPAYGRLRVDMKRRGIFIATTNEDIYLKSETGNRRFWPIETGHIDLAKLKADRDQLWAEAAWNEARGVSIELPITLRAEAAEQQERRRETDSWANLVLDAIAKAKNPKDLSVLEILTSQTFHLSPLEIRQVEQNRVSRVLKRLGFMRYQKRVGEERIWRYFISGDSGDSGDTK